MVNLHFHSLVLDGVFTRASPAAPPTFRPTPPPTDEEIAQLLALLQRRVRRLLVRGGRLPEDDTTADPFAEPQPLFASALAASAQDCVAWVRAQGQADGDFERLPATRYPEAYPRSLTVENGRPRRVLEAVSAGVILSSLGLARRVALPALARGGRSGASARLRLRRAAV